MAIPYIFIQNISDRSLNILHSEKDNFNYTPLEPKQIIKMNYEIVDYRNLLKLEMTGAIKVSLLIPAIKEEIKYTKYNRFEIMDI